MKNKLKLLHISDSHQSHDMLNIPKGIDVIVHSGDCSNYRESTLNEAEVHGFLRWYSEIDVPHKIFVGGNHDVSIERRLVTPGEITSKGIIYLENSATEIEGIKFWGSPITPSFGVGWAWNKDRGKIHRVWDSIPNDVDVIITHGPPKRSLDMSYDRDGAIEYCGCQSLANRINEIHPKLVLFGHIHNMSGIENQGVLYKKGVYYSNGSIVEDGKMGGISSEGNLFEIDLITKKVSII